MDKIENYLVINNKLNKKQNELCLNKEKTFEDKIEDYVFFVFFSTIILSSLFFLFFVYFQTHSTMMIFPISFTVLAALFYFIFNIKSFLFVLKIGGRKKLISLFHEEKLKNIDKKKEIDEIVKVRNDIYDNISKDMILDYINKHENIDKETYSFLNDRLNYILTDTKRKFQKNELISKIEEIEKIEKKYIVVTN